jgi:hypothetical protein
VSTPGAAIPRQSRARWSKAYRAIASRFPPIDLFERLYDDPADLELLAFIEGLTNDRLRDELGDISLVPPDERVLGNGCSPVMAAFTHLGPSRFSDGSFGVYYAGNVFEVSVAETAYHRAKFLAATKQPPTRIEMRTYLVKLDAQFHDVRSARWNHVHDPDDYGPSQALGLVLKRMHSNGIVYRSVRFAGGECIGAFRPKALKRYQASSFTIQGAHFQLRWDGSRITDYFLVTAKSSKWLPIPS